MTEVLELHSHQMDARNATWKAFRGGARSALLVMATGTGKTITSAGIILPVVKVDKKVLFVAHRGELLDQAARTFRRFSMSVGYEKAGAHVNPSALPDVTLASVQTMKGKRLERFARDAFYSVIVDEGHHGAANSYKAILTHFEAKVLALSATPDRADGKPLADVYEAVPYRLEIGQAVARGILCPIQLLDVAVEELQLDRIKTTAGDFAPGELEQEVLRDGVLHAMAKPLAEQARGRRTVAFLPGVESAHRFVDVLGGYGVKAVAVDGGMTAAERKAGFEAYESGAASVICSSALLDEGWDSPATNCVALCSPTKSRARLVQRIGRGTRKSPETGKVDLLVLNFVPGSITKAKLVAPEDALAGAPVVFRRPIGVTYKQRERERAQEVADEELARTESQRRLVQEVGVAYSIAKMSLADFLAAVGASTDGPEPTAEQLETLDRLGFSKAEIGSVRTSAQAAAAIEACRKRGDARLCTRAQARRLAGYGYPDTISKAEASSIIDRLAANRWRPIESKASAATYGQQHRRAS